MIKKNKKFNWGIIGTGGIANAFARDLENLNRHQISSVLSRSMDSAIEFCSRINNCEGYDSISLFLDNEKIDAVYIATPNTCHANQTIRALQNKIPVLCEKPFAMNAAESKAMIKASEKNKTTLMEGMWTRYLPHIQKVKQILNNGTIGQVESIFACHGQNLRHSNNPRLWTKELGGGALLDLGVYVISFAHLVLGKPKEIYASSVFTSEGVDAKTSMIFKYSNDVIANLSCSMYDSQPNRAIISGDKGLIEIDPTFYAPTSMKLKLQTGKIYSFPNKYCGHGLREQAEELERCVRKNKIESPLMTHKDSTEVLGSMDRVRELIGLNFKN
tara:strand:+ start:3194 stop:4183 length:990 start_codon:yes stop_codon:yes gene_type:complete